MSPWKTVGSATILLVLAWQPALAADNANPGQEKQQRVSEQVMRWVRGVVFRPQRVGRATVGRFLGKKHLLDPKTNKRIMRLEGEVRAEGPMLVVRALTVTPGRRLTERSTPRDASCTRRLAG